MEKYKIFAKTLEKIAGDVKEKGKSISEKGKIVAYEGAKVGNTLINFGCHAFESLVLPCDAQKYVFVKQGVKINEEDKERIYQFMSDADIVAFQSGLLECIPSFFAIPYYGLGAGIATADGFIRAMSAMMGHPSGSLFVEVPYHIIKGVYLAGEATKNYFDNAWEQAKKDLDETKEDTEYMFR